MEKPEVQALGQDKVEQQWDICGLYCAYVFKKGDPQRPNDAFKRRGQFDNMKLRREIINVTNWD